MPIKKAAKKYMRVTARKTEKNRKIKGSFRSAIKATNEAIAGKDVAKAKEYFQKAVKALDKAVQKKIIHKNTAARRKSRLNAKIKNLAKK